MAAEVRLEVEDRELVALVKREELAKGRIRLDGLLVHKVVGTRVRHDRLRDSRAANLRALGEREKRAELIRDLHRRREDAGLLDLTLNRLGLAAATALGLLDDASRLLLKRLEAEESRLKRGLEATELLMELLDVLEEDRAI